MEAVFFYILATTVVIFSFLTVSSNNILRAAVYLLFVLCATAGIYFMMNFNFLAAVQLTVYAGGIIVLIIFSILLTHRIDTQLELPVLKRRIIGGVVSVLAGLTLLWAISTYTFNVSATEIANTDIRTIGFQLMDYGENGYVLPFEVISVLLLAVMIAAIIIAKKFSHD